MNVICSCRLGLHFYASLVFQRLSPKTVPFSDLLEQEFLIVMLGDLKSVLLCLLRLVRTFNRVIADLHDDLFVVVEFLPTSFGSDWPSGRLRPDLWGDVLISSLLLLKHRGVVCSKFVFFLHFDGTSVGRGFLALLPFSGQCGLHRFGLILLLLSELLFHLKLLGSTLHQPLVLVQFLHSLFLPQVSSHCDLAFSVFLHLQCFAVLRIGFCVLVQFPSFQLSLLDLKKLLLLDLTMRLLRLLVIYLRLQVFPQFLLIFPDRNLLLHLLLLCFDVGQLSNLGPAAEVSVLWHRFQGSALGAPRSRLVVFLGLRCSLGTESSGELKGPLLAIERALPGRQGSSIRQQRTLRPSNGVATL
mmetsp:Transcript_9112/g.16676  ORF Transcript_9112/g.16676 Transcript_9112/m.16676 type:complete len:357 (+) Transcript_9112:325-1395(+)